MKLKEFVKGYKSAFTILLLKIKQSAQTNEVVVKVSKSIQTSFLLDECGWNSSQLCLLKVNKKRWILTVIAPTKWFQMENMNS